MSRDTIKYSNGEVTVIWKPAVCTHSTNCWKELREVFDPFKKPWVTIEGSTTEKIVEQVKRCPSGALSYMMTEAKNSDNQPA